MGALKTLDSADITVITTSTRPTEDVASVVNKDYRQSLKGKLIKPGLLARFQSGHYSPYSSH